MDTFLILSGVVVAMLCTVIVGFDYLSMRRLTDLERTERQTLDSLMRGELAK